MKNKTNPALRKVCITAMLTALSVVIGIFCKNFFTWQIYYRVTFENLPLIMVGYCFGPVWGFAAAVIADLVSCLCSVNPAVNPIITCGAALVGILSGTVPALARAAGKKYNAKLTLALSVASAHLFGQVIVKSIGKIVFYAMPWVGVFIGLGISCVVGVAEFFLIRLILKIREIGKIMKELSGHELL